jgi:enoyl-CoA hydratase
MADYEYEDILYEVDGKVAYVTLNRPNQLNALSNRLRGEMMHAMKVAEMDNDVNVIVLRSAGRAFSAGYDLAGGTAAMESPYTSPLTGRPDSGSTRPGPSEWAHHVNDTNWLLWNLYKPIIAQIHGYCLAGGTELASMCDLRVVAEDARIGYPPVRAMTVMDMMWAPWHLPMAKAREFAYFGDTMTGEEAASWGWANKAVPADQLDEAVRTMANRLALVDREMLMYSKRAVNRAYEIMGIKTALDSGADINTLSSMRPLGGVFGQISAKHGLKEALEWRDGPFGDGRLHVAYKPRKEFDDVKPQGRPGQR